MKSPTSELARLEHRGSHRLQLMKASLYADGAGTYPHTHSHTRTHTHIYLYYSIICSDPSPADMMEEVSSFSGDQLVPHAAMTSPHPTSDTIREVVQTVDTTQVQPEGKTCVYMYNITSVLMEYICIYVVICSSVGVDGASHNRSPSHCGAEVPQEDTTLQGDYSR